MKKWVNKNHTAVAANASIGIVVFLTPHSSLFTLRVRVLLFPCLTTEGPWKTHCNISTFRRQCDIYENNVDLLTLRIQGLRI